MISIVTTCKGRIHHLKQTFPSFAHQFDQKFSFRKDYEIIVVDYGCPDKTTEEMVIQNNRYRFPLLKIIKVQDNTEQWNPGRARNIGACQAIGDYLFFVDADMILQPTVIQSIEKIIQKKNPVIIRKDIYKGIGDKNGTCVVRAKEFHEQRGYNEKGIGWCFEDVDLYNRLDGYKRNYIYQESEIKITPIEHGWDLRTKFNTIKDVGENLNTYYWSGMCREINHVNKNGYGQGRLQIFIPKYK